MTVRSPIWVVFWILMLNFLVLLVNATIPAAAQWSNNYMFIAILVFALFVLLGIALLLLTLTGNIRGLLKKFLVLTACATIAIPIGFVALEPVPPPISDIAFFAIVIAFLVGAIGSIVLARRQPKQASPWFQ